jgi:hypothetical protein
VTPAGANSSQDPISKITRAKWTAGVAQAVEYLFAKWKVLSSNPGPINDHKKKSSFIVELLIMAKHKAICNEVHSQLIVFFSLWC